MISSDICSSLQMQSLRSRKVQQQSSNMEKMEPKPGLLIPHLSPVHTATDMLPWLQGALCRALLPAVPRSPRHPQSPSQNPSNITHPGPGSSWHFPSTQFTKLDPSFFIIYTNILNYFSSNPKYLFLIYGCKYGAGKGSYFTGSHSNGI